MKTIISLLIGLLWLTTTLHAQSSTNGGSLIPSAPIKADSSVKGDSILDQPIPLSLMTNLDTPCTIDSKNGKVEHFMLTIPSYQESISLIEKLSGKKVVQPRGMPVWQQTSRLETGNCGLGGLSDEPLKEFISRLCLCALGLVWHYDGKQDAIILDYPWIRDDPRSMKELADVLIQTKPVRWGDLQGDPKPNQVGGHGQLLDPWRLAFNALLSKPENYMPSSAVRLFHETHGNTSVALMTDMPDNLFAGKVRDNNAQEMILVLNKQESPDSESGAGDVAYYLFNTEGRLLKGGVYSVGGFRGLVNKADLVDSQHLTIEIPPFFGSSTNLINFELLKGDLVFQSWCDAQGKKTKAVPSQLTPMIYGGTEPGQLRYTAEGSTNR